MLRSHDRQSSDNTTRHIDHAGCGPIQVWYEYGTFCMRTSKQGQAEQCMREAVAIDPSHKSALMALAALLWHTGLHTDAAHLDQAETVLHAAREAAPDDAAVWALLTLLYASMAARRLSEHRNAAFEMRRLAKLSNRRKLAGNPYLQVCFVMSSTGNESISAKKMGCWHLSLRLAIKTQSTYMPNTIKPCNHSCSYLASHHRNGTATSLASYHVVTKLSSKEPLRCATSWEASSIGIQTSIHQEIPETLKAVLTMDHPARLSRPCLFTAACDWPVSAACRWHCYCWTCS